jgi:gliding motility-associated-like protein
MFKTAINFLKSIVKYWTPKLNLDFSRIILTPIILLFFSISSFAQPNLGEIVNFALFSSNGALSNSGTSYIEGNIGVEIGTVAGFGAPTVVTGTTEILNTLTAQCVLDAQSAYNQLVAAPETIFIHAPAFGGGETVFPGVYDEAGAGSLSGNLTLDALGDPSAVFIFRFGGAFPIAAASNVILTNGAKSCNVFWVANGAIAAGAGTNMIGTLIAGPGAVSMAAGGTLEGRMITTNGAIALDNVSIIAPCMTLALDTINVECTEDVPVFDILVVTGVNACNLVPLTIVFVSDVSDGLTCPETITRTYSATDDCGNETTVIQKIIINDITNPTASNLPPISVECIGDVPVQDITLVDDEADNCIATLVVAFVSDVSDGLTCPETITRTYSVTDECGNGILVTQLITVNDITDPTASNPAPINVECISDVPLADITHVIDEADNCIGTLVVAFVSDVSDGLTCPVTITRTYSVTDDCNNQILVTQLITVNDITNPTASNLPPLNVECIGDVPLADITLVIDEADNCTASPVVAFVSDVSDGLTCPVTITRTYSVTDDCDNQFIVTQLITVNDITNPTASNLPSLNVECMSDVPLADITLVIDEVDNCTASPVVAFVSDISDGLTCPVTITRTYSVTDDCDNQIIVTQLITVNDIINPTASNLAPINVECIEDVPLADITLVIDEADNCTASPVVAFVSDVSDGLTCSETITRTYSVTDDCGNGILVTQLITVNDITDPTASNPAPITIECISDLPLADITHVIDEADNCIATLVVAFVSDVSDGLTCPETITRTYSVTDDCDNQILVTQLITVNDITDPTASNPAPINVECISDVPLADITVVIDEADNCTASPVVVFVSDVSDGLTCPVTITRTYSVTDDCDNQFLVTQLITVNDITDPTASNLPPLNVECMGDVPLVDINVVIDEADNCTVSPVVAFVSDISDGLTCPLTITRTYSVTDDCDNQIVVTQLITVNDIINPTASNLPPLNVECVGDALVDIALVIDEADNCTVSPVVAFVSDVSDGLTCPETITRTYSVTDNCGNGILITQLITVNDITDPTASNPAPISVECISDVPLADITLVIDEADNCTASPVVAFVSDVSDGDICNTEVITRTYSITDNCGNEILVTQLITVNAVYPTLNAGIDQVVCEEEFVVLNAEYIPVATTITWSNLILDGVPFTSPFGTTTYTVSGDNCGCISTDALSVTVNLNPDVSFISNTNSGCEPLNVTFTNTTVSMDPLISCIWNLGAGAIIDDCGLITYMYEEAGLYEVSLTTIDANGCSSEQTIIDYIYVEPNPVANFTASDYSLNDLSITSEIDFDNTSIGASSYYWDFSDGGTSTNQDPSHFFQTIERNNHEITLIAYSDFGCSDTTSQLINVEEVLIYYIPNTFTPDGNNLNNVFQPIFTEGFDPYDYSLFIYDRWGELLFVSYNAIVGWDGAYGDQLVQDGTYVWVIEFKSNVSDKKYKEMGHVNVLR